MGMHEQVERFKGSNVNHPWRYQWWTRADAIRMLGALKTALEAGSADTKLLAIRGVNDDGLEVLWMCTEDQEVYGVGFDNSHPCPPAC